MIPKPLRSVLWLFIAINLFTVIFYSGFKKIDTDPDVFLIGNTFLCVITIASYLFMSSGSRATSTVRFTSAVYGSFLMKLVFSVLIVIVYSKWAGNKMNTNGIVGCLFLYLVYMFLEVKGLMSLFRKD